MHEIRCGCPRDGQDARSRRLNIFLCRSWSAEQVQCSVVPIFFIIDRNGTMQLASQVPLQFRLAFCWDISEGSFYTQPDECGLPEVLNARSEELPFVVLVNKVGSAIWKSSIAFCTTWS